MDNEKRLESVAAADATAGFLHEIAWDEIVKPALLKERNNLTTILVGAVLGKDPANGLTREQIAGMVYGVDRLIRAFDDIIKRGTTALEQLESQGFCLTANNL